MYHPCVEVKHYFFNLEIAIVLLLYQEFGISDFEEISSLSHSVVFLYFFALIAEEGFLISSCYLGQKWYGPNRSRKY